MERRPQTVEAEPEHRHQEPDGERRAGLAVGAFEAGECRRHRRDDLDDEEAEHRPLDVIRVGGPARKYSEVTEIPLRLRCTAWTYDHRKQNTPTANKVSAVIAPTHCKAVVKNTAASTAVTTNMAVPARSAAMIRARSARPRDPERLAEALASTSWENSDRLVPRDASAIAAC